MLPVEKLSYQAAHCLNVATIEFSAIIKQMSGDLLRFVAYNGHEEKNGRFYFRFIVSSGVHLTFLVPTHWNHNEELEQEMNLAFRAIYDHFRAIKYGIINNQSIQK